MGKLKCGGKTLLKNQKRRIRGDLRIHINSEKDVVGKIKIFPRREI